MAGKKIKGNIVFHCRDEYGEMFVADSGQNRALYFGDGIMQSCIQLDNPGFSFEGYNQAMLSSLLFISLPKRVLLIGLGGSSLVHFLLRALPACSVEVVELRQKVIDLSFEFFLLPKHNTRLTVKKAAGEDYIMQGIEAFDLIIIDAFDDEGPASALSDLPFFSSCRQRLNTGGVCTANLWYRPKDNFPVIYEKFRESFSGNTLRLLPDEKSWNTIIFGFDRPVAPGDLASLRSSAKKLEQQYDYNIDFPRYLQLLSRQNFG